MSAEPERGSAAAVSTIDATRESMRASMRGEIGVSAEGSSPPLRSAIRASGVGWYPLLALSFLVIVDELQGYVLGVLAPDITATLGISINQFALLVQVKTIAIVVATLPIAALTQRGTRRALLSIVTAVLWSLITILTGFVAGIWALLALMVLDGIATGTVRAVHLPLLVDSYPTTVRMRALATYRGADAVGSIIGPLLIGIIVAILGYTWRGAFVGMGLFSLVAALFAVRLRDPGYGKWDTERVREAVRRKTGQTSEPAPAPELRFFEITSRLVALPTFRRGLMVGGVLGIFYVPLATYMGFYLNDRWSMGAGARSLFAAVMPLFVLATLALCGRAGERMFHRDPERLVRVAGWFMVIGAALVPAGIYAPRLGLMVLCLGLSGGFLGALGPALNMMMLSIVPARMRPHSAALFGLVTAAVGATGGLLLMAALESRFGLSVALASAGVPGVIGGLLVVNMAKLVNRDMDTMLDSVVEEETVRSLAASGATMPILSCQHIDFSYGRLQVLFDVGLTVQDGEMVALLGTNGAGKSTVLRVIAGVALPERGSVRLDGADITFVDAERRLRLGINSISGGKAVFPPLTVVENMRLFAYSHGRQRAEVERGIDASFAAFPRLADRRDQLASTLSGGEQQMLALSKALIVPPRLLLIDELSLGLAPKIVGELLETVRTINANGSAVVLVEQSVNVALNLAEHAYFMEKGEIRFDGRTRDLLERPDLLRAVFLQGAAEGLSTASKSDADR